jgi:xanthine dehydrogenase YagR molybdenum-binding subunit
VATSTPVPINPVAANRHGLIGKPFERIDGPLKVSGRATYAYEYLNGKAVYGFIVDSAAARARITDLDAEAAEQVPGVIAVLTFRNAPRLAAPHPRVSENRFDRQEPFLQGPNVRYFGEPVALVVADTFEAARDAAGRVRVRYAKDPDAIFELEANQDRAYKPGRVNAGFETDSVRGDFDAAFVRAPVKIDATYIVPDEHNNPMEPHAAIAEWNGDSLTLYSGQQVPTWTQSALAKTFQLPTGSMRVVTPYIGGGFGSKVPLHAQAVLAAMAAKVVGRPVKVALTRQQMFANTNHRPRTIQRMRLGAEQDGRLTAIAHDAVVQTTFHDEFVEQSAAFSRPLYAAPNRVHRHRAVMLDLPAGDIMRAPGEEPGSFAMECGMDELAVALAMDPVELRIKNEPQVDPENDLPFSSRMNVQCLQEGASRFGWAGRPKTPGAMTDGRWMVGYGVACALFPTYIRPSSASVRLGANGRVLVRMAATDIGTGTYTILAQIAAECFGVPLENVDVEIGDSNLPPSAGSGGSFGAASSGSALLLACEQLRSRLAELAASDAASPLRGADPAVVTLSNDRIEANGRSESLGAFMARVAPRGLEAQASHGGAAQPAQYSMHAHGAQFAEVGVDCDTGEIRLRRMLGVFACGRILNARTARSQLIGGMIMGVGAGLSEESLLDVRDGSFVNRDLAEYHVPVNADIADIDAIMLEEHEDHANPLGIKGLGEVGIVGAGAAVANAVYNATGVRVREFPVTLDKLLPHLPAGAGL